MRYTYEGPVLIFGKVATPRWYGETMAVSEKKAKSNLAYQYKRQHGKTACASVSLPGKLMVS
jgi:hypothetical protein